MKPADNASEAAAEQDFATLLARRSAWRWAMTGLLLGSYFCYALGGLYFPEHYAGALPGTAIPGGIFAGLLIIVLSVVASLVYVRVIGKLTTVAPNASR